MVFSLFAELGDAARLYLLKNKMIGRLLDIFYHPPDVQATPSIHNKFRNTSLSKLPLFVIDKEMYIHCTP